MGGKLRIEIVHDGIVPVRDFDSVIEGETRKNHSSEAVLAYCDFNVHEEDSITVTPL